MTKMVRIPLPTPVEGHKGMIREIVLREPTYDEYISCGGEPYSIGQSEDGIVFQIEKPEVIWAYAEACIQEPGDRLMLNDQGWRVAREVRKAILGFFRAPDVAAAPSQTSPTTSSSSSTSPSTPSDD
ncbi:hypothetical protein [Methylobacterium sp. A54F]